ncbi:MAG: hypothetical protein K6E83_11970 [Clostridium sp.]|nr:hypothetical protein [Clostridium sp.]
MKKIHLNHISFRRPACAAMAALLVTMTACSGETTAVPAKTETVSETVSETPSGAEEGPEASGESEYSGVYEDSADGGHAITADGESASYRDAKVVKTGEAEGDEADFYGANAAVFATNGAVLDLDNMEITTGGTHANAVFSYGEGTVVNIKDSVIETSGNCSGGLMTTGGGTMNATGLTIHTTGNSSAAIRSDRGGGTVNVTDGIYTTDGVGSPAIYSTADITVSDAELTSTASQGVVVEGKNSVTLNEVKLTADNNKKNGSHSDYYQAVMIYQSMSGDADEGLAEFTTDGGSITNKNGDVFFVNNTRAKITLSGTDIVNEGDGVFLRAAAAGWGREGSNGGHVDLYADTQSLEDDMIVDSISTLNLYLSDDSSFTGAINPEGADGQVYVELADGAKWTLTGDSYITSLTCGADAIDLNGHKLMVGDKEYSEGTASQGEAIVVTVENAGKGMGGEPPQGGKPDGKPGDGKGGPQGQGGQPPQGGKPDGKPEGGPQGQGGQPPQGEKPDGMPEGGQGGQPPQGQGGEPPQGNPPEGAPGEAETSVEVVGQ